MTVAKDRLDKELRPYWTLNRVFSFLMTRKWGIKLLLFCSVFVKGKNIKGLHCEEHYCPSNNGGPAVRVRVYKPLNSTENLPAMLYMHGGGYIVGSPEMSSSIIKKFIASRPCVVVAPDYRKALEAPFPAGFNDCYDTLLWAKANANSLGIDDSSFIIAGHSAGGGLTAAVTLKARDTHDVDVAFQMPIYPMIDDRQLTESARDMNVPPWSTKNNAYAWGLYLKDHKESQQPIPAYAAAARNSDYQNFPPTITFVGELEPFRDETIAYVDALKQADIPVAFTLYEGCFHGFDLLGGKSSLAKQATVYTYQMYADYYDTYVDNRYADNEVSSVNNT